MSTQCTPGTGSTTRTTGRAPTGRAPRRTDGLAGRLNAEWEDVVAAQVDAELPGWARREPDLAPLDGVEGLEAATAGRDNDAVLRALLRLHRGGEPLAGRTLLQLLLGVALGLARRTAHHAGGDREEAEARAVTELLDLLGTVQLASRARIVDRLALDLLSRLTRDARRPGTEHCVGGALEVEDVAAGHAGRGRGGAVPAPHDPGGAPVRADLAVLDVLVSGTRSGAIKVDEARLLWEVHSPAHRGGIAELAHVTGLPATALRQRVSRARRRLVAELAVSAA
jgi:hypothetical protein